MAREFSDLFVLKGVIGACDRVYESRCGFVRAVQTGRWTWKVSRRVKLAGDSLGHWKYVGVSLSRDAVVRRLTGIRSRYCIGGAA